MNTVIVRLEDANYLYSDICIKIKNTNVQEILDERDTGDLEKRINAILKTHYKDYDYDFIIADCYNLDEMIELEVY